MRAFRSEDAQLRRSGVGRRLRALVFLRKVKLRLAPEGSRAQAFYRRWLSPWILRALPVLPVVRPRPPLELPSNSSKLIDEVDGLRFPSSRSRPCVSILIPVRDHWRTTYDCLSAVLRNTSGPSYEVIVLDDASSDETPLLLARMEGARVVRNPEPLGFLRNCNAGAAHARGEFLVLLNNDTLVHQGWLAAMVDAGNEEGVGLVGARLVSPDGSLQEAGGIVWSNGHAWNYGRGEDPDRPAHSYRKDVDYCSAACVLIRRDLWSQIGGFDERYAPAYYEDADLAFAVRARGFRVRYQPRAVVTHVEGVSHGTDLSAGVKRYQQINRETFREKWGDALAGQHEGPEECFLARDRSRGRPVVAIVDNNVPSWDADAGSRAVYMYMRLFHEQGCKVVFIPDNRAAAEPHTTTLQDMGVEVIYGPWPDTAPEVWLERHGPQLDLLLLSRPSVSQRYWALARRFSRATIVYQAIDLHFLREQRRHELAGGEGISGEARDLERLERSLVEACDVTWVYSEHERDLLRSTMPDREVHAVPIYFYDQTTPDEDVLESRRQDLLFVGGFRHPPNEDGLLWFVREILPLVRRRLPEVRLRVVGFHATDAVRATHGQGVEVLGGVSDARLAELYGETRLVIVPLRYGAGVRGKLVEAMAWGVPVVSTTAGAEGIPDPCPGLTIADDPVAIADALVALYDDPVRRREKRLLALAYVRRHFSKAVAEAVVSELLVRVARRKAHAGVLVGGR